MRWLRAGAARWEFERFVADSADRLLRTGYLMSSDLPEAEDLVQETLLRVARRWHRVRSMEHPAAYARQVLINLAIDGAPGRARRHGEIGLPGTARLADLRDARAERALHTIDARGRTAGGAGAAPAPATRGHRAQILGGPSRGRRSGPPRLLGAECTCEIGDAQAEVFGREGKTLTLMLLRPGLQ